MNLYFILLFIIISNLFKFLKKKFAGEYLLFQHSVVRLVYDMTFQKKKMNWFLVRSAILPNEPLGFVFNRILCIHRFCRSHHLSSNG